MLIIPKTFNGALELEDKIQKIGLDKSLVGYCVYSNHPLFDFSLLKVEGIDISQVFMSADRKRYCIQASKGQLKARLDMTRSMCDVRFERDAFIEGFNLTRNNVEKTFFGLASDISSVYKIGEAQILNAIEALWQEGYQFDEYLPGFVERGPVNINRVLGTIRKAPEREYKIIGGFRAYWMSRVILNAMDDLWSDGHLMEVDDYDDFIRKFLDVERKFTGIVRTRDLGALYSTLGSRSCS